MGKDRRGYSRREWLSGFAAVGAVAFTGCPDDGTSGSDGGGDGVAGDGGTAGGDGSTAGDDSSRASENGVGGGVLAGAVDDADDEPPGSSGDWGQFRGDSRNTGVAPAGTGPGRSLALDWSTSFPERIETDGQTLVQEVSMPILAGDVLVVAAGVVGLGTPEPTSWLFGLDPTTGDTAWKRGFRASSVSGVPDPVSGGNGDSVFFPRFPPTDAETACVVAVVDPASGDVVDEYTYGRRIWSLSLADGRGYGGDISSLVAVTLSDGSLAWSSDVEGYAALPYPAVTDDAVYRSAGSEFVALDRETGDPRWRRAYEMVDEMYFQGPAPFAPPTVVDGAAFAAGGMRSYSVRAEGGLVSFDPADGAERWRFKPSWNRTTRSRRVLRKETVYGHPLVIGSTVYVTGGRGKAVIRDDQRPQFDWQPALFGLDVANGSLLWETDAPVAFAPVATTEVVYLVSPDAVVAVSPAGTVLDRLRGFPGSAFQARSPALGRERLFFSTTEGVVAVGNPG